jgi:hypothetical protein
MAGERITRCLGFRPASLAKVRAAPWIPAAPRQQTSMKLTSTAAIVYLLAVARSPAIHFHNSHADTRAVFVGSAHVDRLLERPIRIARRARARRTRSVARQAALEREYLQERFGVVGAAEYEPFEGVPRAAASEPAAPGAVWLLTLVALQRNTAGSNIP